MGRSGQGAESEEERSRRGNPEDVQRARGTGGEQREGIGRWIPRCLQGGTWSGVPLRHHKAVVRGLIKKLIIV